MTAMQWQERYLGQVASMDAQHEQLMSMMDQYCEGIRRGEAERVIRDVLPGLLRYARNHFNAEETLMDEVGFPGTVLHQASHFRLLQQVEEFMETLEEESLSGPAHLGAFLIRWLRNHIEGEDRQYSDYIHQQGRSEGSVWQGLPCEAIFVHSD